MLAPVFFPPETEKRRRPAPRTARDATQRRKAYSRKRSYQGPLRICLTSIVIVAAVVGYLWLMTRVQALDNRSIAAQTRKEHLQEESIDLQDRIATLESRDRLFGVAAREGMHDPSAFVIVTVPNPPVADESHGSLVGAVESWLRLK